MRCPVSEAGVPELGTSGNEQAGPASPACASPRFPARLAIIQQFQSRAVAQDFINKEVQNETEKQASYPSQTSQERKFLEEEEKAKSFMSKFTCTVISSYSPVYDQILFFQTCHHMLPKF